jgi:hypothetical protein
VEELKKQQDKRRRETEEEGNPPKKFKCEPEIDPGRGPEIEPGRGPEMYLVRDPDEEEDDEEDMTCPLPATIPASGFSIKRRVNSMIRGTLNG